jgi:hypothetical protein
MQLAGTLNLKLLWRNSLDKLYFKVDNVLSKDACELLAGSLLLCEQTSDPNGFNYQDKQTLGAYSRYGYSGTDALMFYLHPKMEEWTGKKLHPTFSYARVYRNGHDLWRHRDRAECEYSITITLKEDGTVWPIIMGDEALVLPQGSGCVYMGEKILHERKPYEGNEQVQVFCHYVDINGPYADRATEGREIHNPY